MSSPYAANVIRGNVGADDVNTSKQARNVTKGCYEIIDQNHLAPMLAFQTYASGGKRSKNWKHEWHSKGIFPHWDVVTTGDTAGTTLDLVVTNINYFAVDDLVVFPKATVTAGQTKHGVITVVNTGTSTITVVPVHPTATNMCAVANSENVHNISNSSAELSNRPGQKLVKVDNHFNYIPFLRVPYETGIYELGMEQYTGSEADERYRETSKEIKMQFERDLIFSQLAKKTKDGKLQLFQKGFIATVQDNEDNNVFDGSGAFTETQFNEFLIKGPMRFGSQSKFLYTSADLQSHIADFMRSDRHTVQTETILGVEVLKYKCTNGRTLKMVQHHMLEEDYDGWGLIQDIGYCDIIPFANHPLLSYHPNIHVKELAGIGNEWRAMGCLEMGLFAVNGLITA